MSFRNFTLLHIELVIENLKLELMTSLIVSTHRYEMQRIGNPIRYNDINTFCFSIPKRKETNEGLKIKN